MSIKTEISEKFASLSSEKEIRAFVPEEYVWWAGIPYALILAAAVAVRLCCAKKPEEYTFD